MTECAKSTYYLRICLGAKGNIEIKKKQNLGVEIKEMKNKRGVSAKSAKKLK